MHDSEKEMRFAGECVEHLAKRGVNKLAFELPYDMQGAVDAYMDSKKTRADKLAYCRGMLDQSGVKATTLNGITLDHALSQVPSVKGLLGILDKAAELGMKVVCVDKSTNDINRAGLAGEMLEAKGAPAEKVLLAMDIPDRNRVMADRINKMTCPEESVVYVGGFYHCGKGKSGATMDDRLTAKGFLTTSMASAAAEKELDWRRNAAIGNEISGPDIVARTPKDFKNAVHAMQTETAPLAGHSRTNPQQSNKIKQTVGTG